LIHALHATAGGNEMLDAGMGKVASLFDAQIERLDDIDQARRAKEWLERYVCEQRHRPGGADEELAERACQRAGPRHRDAAATWSARRCSGQAKALGEARQLRRPYARLVDGKFQRRGPAVQHQYLGMVSDCGTLLFADLAGAAILR
jgi:hypothetical protein